MKRDMVKLVGGLLVGGVAVLLVLSGCGGSKTPAVAVKEPAPVTTPKPAESTPTPATPPPANDPVAEGRQIFMVKAAGVGCQACHGIEGKGNETVGAPDIRGRSEADVRKALTGVAMMQIIKLTDAEITAVVEFLQTLK